LDRKAAETTLAVFEKPYGVKYADAVECLTQDCDALLAFYDFPAAQWDHVWTTNLIARVFATVRPRMVRTNGTLAQKTARRMVFKLIMATSRTGRRL
jgi:putative transposase